MLERKAARIRKEMAADPEKGGPREVRTRFDNNDRSWKQIISKALIRPFKLFYCEPIVQLLGVYMAFIYGLMYRKFPTVCSVDLELTCDLSASVLDNNPRHIRRRVP